MMTDNVVAVADGDVVCFNSSNNSIDYNNCNKYTATTNTINADNLNYNLIHVADANTAHKIPQLAKCIYRYAGENIKVIPK